MTNRQRSASNNNKSVKWDIVDDVASSLQIGGRLRGQITQMATSAVIAILTVAIAAGSPAATELTTSIHAAGQSIRAVRSASNSVRDTEVGLSAGRLASAFSSHFQPAEPETNFSTEYSFF
jgi:hypothetical protein